MRRTVFVHRVEREEHQDDRNDVFGVELHASNAGIPSRVVDLVRVAHLRRGYDVVPKEDRVWIRKRASHVEIGYNQGADQGGGGKH